MEKMKEIQNKEDFLKWAHQVNLSTENKRNGIADLQDVFCRGQDGEMKSLTAMFLEVNATEKQLLTFSIIKAMGEETAYKFIKAWARKQADIVINEYQKDIEDSYKKLSEEKMAFITEKREIENKLSASEITINELRDALKLSRINNDGLYSTISRLQQKIDEQDKDLGAANKDLTAAGQFKSYLKGILESQDVFQLP